MRHKQHSPQKSSPANPYILQAYKAYQAGRCAEAQAICEESLRYKRSADILHLLGVVLLQQQQPALALEHISEAIRLSPHNAEIYNNRAHAKRALGDLQGAEDDHSLAIGKQAKNALFYSQRGIVRHDLGRFDEAIADYNSALRLNPADAHLYCNRGLSRMALGQVEFALQDYAKSIACKPNFYDAHFNRAIALRHSNRLVEAMASYREVLRFAPNHAKAHNNLGNILTDLRALDEAIKHFDNAITIDAKVADYYHNRATARQQQNAMLAAIADYDIALSMNPHYPDANVGKATSLLATAQFAEGWLFYEWRWECPQFPTRKRLYPQPLWRGEPLFDKTILLYCEQGLGDSLQFCRYVTLLHNLGARVILQAPDNLVPLFSSLAGIYQVLGETQALPNFDYHCPLLSLPLLCKTFKVEDIPAQVPYLFAPADKVATWQQKLGVRQRPRVGLVWRSGFWHVNAHRRNVPLAMLLDALRSLNVDFYSLQKGEGALELNELGADLGCKVCDETDALDDFADTAALISQLDLVISVDTSVLHLAGALGKPVWLLARYDACWRWLLGQERSPWYPSLKIYRQQQLDDWHEVMQRVASDLATQLNGNHMNEQTPVAQQQLLQAFSAHQAGRLEEARSGYDAVLKLIPHHSDAIHLLGVILYQNGEHQAAIDKISEAIALAPQFADPYNNRGNARKAFNQLEEAEKDYSQAIKLQPSNPAFYNNRALVLHDLQRIEEAINDYYVALRLNPNYAEAYSNLGLALVSLDKFDEAVKNYDRAIAINPNFHDAYYNRGIALRRQKRSLEAAESYREALRLFPQFAKAHNNLGNILSDLHDADGALVHFNAALSADPKFAEAYHNRATLRQQQNALEEALTDYNTAIQYRPNYPDACLGKAMNLLVRGNFREGWPMYEWRWECPLFPTPKRQYAHQPLWRGESLTGKTILLYSEQGLGDSLQFCRYSQLLAMQGAKIILETHAPLFSLFKSLAGVTHLIEFGQDLPSFDYHCPLMSLPLAMQHFAESDFPSQTPYLSTHVEKHTFWQHRVPAVGQRKIGLVWRGGSLHKGDLTRSIPLATLLPYLPADNVYVSLQKELRDEDKTDLARSGIYHFGDELHDFSDTAALASTLDMVISVDTSVAHLSGALNLPTYLLLPFSPEWRWLMERSDSPWYPSMRIFRQPHANDWHSVLGKMRSAL